MPIYEYRCLGCGQKASIFFRSISVVEANPVCPHCDARRLERLVSRVWSRRSNEGLVQPTFEDDGVPFYGSDPFADPYRAGDLPEEYGDESEADVAALAREARAMAQMMGEPLDAGFETALRHVERGADPDEVFGELDAVESTRERATDDDNP